MMSEQKKIIDILNSGGAVVIPTDTQYALCADATNEKAVQKIYDIKKRDTIKSLPVFYASFEDVEKKFEFDDVSKKLCKKFWPGQLSVVLNRKPDNDLAKSLNSKDSSVMVRIPNCEFIMELVRNFGRPITATSANISGEKDIIDASEVDYLMESEEVSHHATPSTIVSCVSGSIKIIRQGAVELEDV